MPPLYQDPLSAVPGAAWSLADVARALAEVACEAWALVLVALAVYSFLERDVRGVLKSHLPLALALAASALLALAARAAGGAAAGVHPAGALLWRAFPSEQATAVTTFAVYTAAVYGRRALGVVLAAAAVSVARASGHPLWGLPLAAGAVAGVVLALTAYALTLRLVPDGHLARLRRARRGRGGPLPLDS